MKPIVTLLILFSVLRLNAQINAYATVTSISTSTTLNVSSSNESYGTFTAGSQVIVMQMQDDVIGTTTNTANFGNLGSIASAGMYEVATVSLVTRSGGNVTQIKINSPLAKTYIFGTHSNVQVISFPLLGTNGFTTTSDIKALWWNGAIGGVVAFRVNGTLTLNHNIYADSAGFRGGTINGGNAGSCDDATYKKAVDENNANKGEGIYKATTATYVAGRGKILNGGGGGNSHNGGGGGGSNVTGGGEGGKGYGCTTSAGGLGGLSLSTYVSPDRIFMGGGGGAGEANNSYNTAGGNGGGIVIINAAGITTTGSGPTRRISANGQMPADVGNDGAGGGGAGGAVLLNVQTWAISASKPLNVSSNGGGGGNVGDAAAHGGGGGGGQGVVIYSSTVPTANITTTTLNGKGGRNYAMGTFAENGTGADNQGIMSGLFAVLPAKLLSFNAVRKENKVEVEWKSSYENEFNRYELQRSDDGNNYKTITSVNAVKSTEPHTYFYVDEKPLAATTYYRLKMMDSDNAWEFSSIAAIKASNESGLKVSLVPNPVRETGTLQISSNQMALGYMRVINSSGMVVSTGSFYVNKGENNIPINNLRGLPTGTYQVSVIVNNVPAVVKMMVQ